MMQTTKPKTFKELMHNSAKILNVHDAMDRLRVWRKEGLPPGTSTGWTGFDPFFKFPPFGNLNVVTGIPSSGKSEWLETLALNMAMGNGWNILSYAPENYPAEYNIQKLVEKYAGQPIFDQYEGYRNVTDQEIDEFEKFIVMRYTFIDCHINNATIEQIINSIFLQSSSQKCQMVMIDPWNKLDSARDRHESETDFIGRTLTRIQMFARQQNISFWIVAHPSKPNQGSKVKSLYDISGSQHWNNMPDNGFILERSWKDKTGTNNVTHCRIAKIKDRRYGKFGTVDFRFNPANGRFTCLNGPDKGEDVPEGGLAF